jgi:chromosomal replication initiation ATPase DnaA
LYQSAENPIDTSSYTKTMLKEVRNRQKSATDRTEAISRLHSRFAPSWVIRIILATADEHGVSPLHILRDCRFKNVVAARNHAVYRVKEKKPTLSSPRIAGWFNRDHTSVLYCLAVHADDTGAPKLCNYNIEAARLRRANHNRRRYHEDAA